MNIESSLLLTDLYQLTMLQGYFEQDMHDTAVFEFFVRDLPVERGYLVAAGLEQLLQFLEHARFTGEEIHWLRQYPSFSRAFVDFLADFRFEGEVHAMAEGTVFFPYEPIVRVTAPLPQAQLVESRLINLLQYPTLVASKAARCVLTAPDKLLVDFGMRRAHGAEAALLAARAAYLAGFAGSATVLANPLFGIPVYGTMAHSFIQAHDSETQAFEHFARAQPDNVTLLIDTYDTEAAADKLVGMAPHLHKLGIRIKAVRLDSGNLGEHARRVRRILDAGGLDEVRIFSSGNLDEYQLKILLDNDAPIDGFGIGTHLDTSADVPYLDCAYKLIEYAGSPRRKKSEGKATWPGRKQVVRHYDDNGVMTADRVTLEGQAEAGESLLHHVMSKGRRLQPPLPLSESRLHAANQLARLPEYLRALRIKERYPVTIEPSIRAVADAIDEAVAANIHPTTRDVHDGHG
jgi:nicotinate phosphoribosyltransferase